MQEPKLDELAIDRKSTARIRRRMAANKSIKITINIDKESLDVLRKKAAQTGVPYQRLLNRLLSNALKNDAETESRIDRLEAEVTKLKRKIVA